MDNKVILPKDVAEAIEYYREMGLNNYYIITQCTSNPTIFDYASKHGNYEWLMNALVNGYDTEQTPEEEVRERFRGHTETLSFYRNKVLDHAEREQERYSCGYVAGVKDFAKVYGIKIEGVNA